MKYSPIVKRTASSCENHIKCLNTGCAETFTYKYNKKYCCATCRYDHRNKNRRKESRESKDMVMVTDLFLTPEAEKIAKVKERMPFTPAPHEKDIINPSYYKEGDIECIDAIKSSMSNESFRGYLKGSIQKYVWRDKENKKEDLDKAIWFINKLKEQL